MRFNLTAAARKLAELARVVQAPGGDADSEGARAEAFIAWLAALKADIGIPARLSDHVTARRVTSDDIPRLTEVATADVCHQTNPRPCQREDFERIFAAAL
jgi:alcohol dehydrogenase class IV